MGFPKRPYTFEMMARMNAELQVLNARMERMGGPDRILDLREKGNKSAGGKPLFSKQPPEVQAKAKEMLDILLIRHKDKLEAKGKGNYYGILCGVAVAMAKTELGLLPSYKERSWKKQHRKRRRSALRTALGLQEHQSWDMSHRPIKGAPPLTVTYTNMDGV
jgi:hypothetical protein